MWGEGGGLVPNIETSAESGEKTGSMGMKGWREQKISDWKWWVNDGTGLGKMRAKDRVDARER